MFNRITLIGKLYDKHTFALHQERYFAGVKQERHTPNLPAVFVRKKSMKYIAYYCY